MSRSVVRDGAYILGARKFPAGNFLGARADRARKSPRMHVPSLTSFRSTVWRYWEEDGRHDLPWRKTKDPYRILVSEVMLQQTQVARVLPKYKEFLKQFPTVQALAKAPLAGVLRAWSGLGYNRRGKYLHDAAKAILEKHRGKVPRTYRELVELPGIGDYTAKAVRVFAFNEHDILIETNIRTAFTHHFFRASTSLHDREILWLSQKAAEGQDPREWHSALMDYGAYLKSTGVRNNHRSAHYVKQSKFKGSLRQARGTILRSLYNSEQNPMRSDLIGFPQKRVNEALAGLARDGLIVEQKGKWRIA